MKITKLCFVAFLTLALLAPPAEARRYSRHGRGGVAAAIILGVAGAVAADRAYRDRYVAPYGAYAPYGYPVPYGYAVPGRAGFVAPPGAYSYIDEGAFRNYRDAAGNYIGRVPLRPLW